ncbi:S53 family peptidase [Actinocatenispora sera]|uniref:S53 family peptidase n=1 Tax=Actinocatenispora sera TaxID=390989 RepID=UPI0033DC6399
MTRSRPAMLVAALAAVLGLTVVLPASAQPARDAGTGVAARRACATPAAGKHQAACLALLDTAADGTALSGADATPLHPFTAADIQSAYQLPSALLGARQTVAIVDAYDDPTAEADLAVYRAANHLPACDADFPCFRKVDQRGGTDYPAPDDGWAVEESLDLDMVSAACPNCHILLVEADDPSFDNLGAAVDEAVALGATVVSNSYGGAEFNGEQDYQAHYDHPGVAITVSSGDTGFGVQVPAAYPTVTAVGGTTLFQDGSARGWGETAWTGAGSGCSAYLAKPKWQKDRLCHKRTVADVAAVADPSTPVAVYDTDNEPGWLAAGGTSVAAPIVAGVYALAGNATTVTNAYPYSHSRALFDVVGGSNGSCGGGYLCQAVPGYDGPTGLGSPHGIGAF